MRSLWGLRTPTRRPESRSERARTQAEVETDQESLPAVRRGDRVLSHRSGAKGKGLLGPQKTTRCRPSAPRPGSETSYRKRKGVRVDCRLPFPAKVRSTGVPCLGDAGQ